MIRYRVLYDKSEPLRYTGMLDIQHIWERLFRRAGLELAYSQGFHPQPKIQQAAPLPLGFLSTYEVLDFWLEGSPTAVEVENQIREKSQPGLEIRWMEEAEHTSPPLQTRLETCEYSVVDLLNLEPEQLQTRIDGILTAKSLPRERRGKNYDLRPLIEKIEYSANEYQSNHLKLLLSAREAATGRPDEVMAAMGLDPLGFRYTRTSLIFSEPIFLKSP